MINIKKILFALLFVSSLLFAKEITLKELVQIAVKNNSNIKLSKYQEDAKDAAFKSSKSGYLPQVLLQGETAKYEIENIDDDVTSITLSASQLLYDFGKTSALINASKEEYQAAKKETMAQTSNVIYQTKQAYYEILDQYQQIALAKESIKIDKLHLEQVEAYFEAGVRTKIDVTDAKLKLSNSNLQLLQANYALKNSKNSLLSLLGTTKMQDLEIKEDENIDELIQKFAPKQIELKKLINTGLKNRAEILMYEKQISAAKLAYSSKTKEYYPVLSLRASHSDKSSNKIASLDTKQTTVGLYLKWNLFTGNSTEANKQNALASLNSIKQQLVQQRIEIEKEITAAYLSVKEAKESLLISSKNKELALQKFDLAKQRYKAGLNDIVELNDSKLQYTQAKSKLINTYYNYLISVAKLEYSIGKVY